MRFSRNRFKKADGYRGIWYSNQKLRSEYKFKYSGGLGTYCAKHIPFAWYDTVSNKTFFCYGGTKKRKNILLHMISYFDHDTGLVPKPTILLNKKTSDAHDNPTLLIDKDGYIWIFSSSHGTSRPSYIHRSKLPRDIDDFIRICTGNFSYPQLHYLKDNFFFLHTKYLNHERALAFMTSKDGVKWSERIFISHIAKGHYQVSNEFNGKIGTAFNFHPNPVGLNARTNLYYIETTDLGKTWTNAAGSQIDIPLKNIKNNALVNDYSKSGKLVYMKDMIFDKDGNPIILCIISNGFESGPENNPRTWVINKWDGGNWEQIDLTESDSNYDMGSLYHNGENILSLIAPTETGPQPYNPGGEICLWKSDKNHHNWKLLQQMTKGSSSNHTYVRRPVNVHPEFIGFWADGNPRQKSVSRLYFCTKNGDVFQLPTKIKTEFVRPIKIGKK